MLLGLSIAIIMVVFLLSTIPVTATDNDFVITDGVLTNYKCSSANVKIPDGIVEIGEFIFTENHVITSVTIPDTVTSIGKEHNIAFHENCN